MKKQNTKKILKTIISFGLAIIMSFSIVTAHSGRTDSSGGHYNRSTGEYHYHHGHPAHDHENGICPYKSNSKTNSSSSTTTSTTNQKEEKITIGKVFSYIFLFVFIGIPYILAIIAVVCSWVIIPLMNLWDWFKKKFNKK